jgi:hypothetical protein
VGVADYESAYGIDDETSIALARFTTSTITNSYSPWYGATILNTYNSNHLSSVLQREWQAGLGIDTGHRVGDPGGLKPLQPGRRWGARSTVRITKPNTRALFRGLVVLGWTYAHAKTLSALLRQARILTFFFLVYCAASERVARPRHPRSSWMLFSATSPPPLHRPWRRGSSP